MELTVLRHLNQVMLTFVQKDFIARLVLFRHNRVQEHLILQQDDKVLMSVLIVHLDIIVPTTT
jgi:hypothetical protein